MKYLKKVLCATASLLALAAPISAVPDRAAAGANPYLGDIIAVGYTFCPRGWTSAEGQLLSINSFQALFSLLGTTYGGDGRTTFGLPDLRGRVAMGQGFGPGLSPRYEGQKFGAETRVLSVNQMPVHSHAVNANNLDGDKAGPGDKLLAAAPPSGTGSETIYSDKPHDRQMSTEMISTVGGNQPLGIQDPYLALRYCIALQGIFPSRN
ncbi:phage tail protein [Puniceibacterium confluentis]|uniref:phage tail protein n=1 Tax=Puniceibacterium confluentis TaxID=1958944 RepID=UPI0011B5A097|nr:tail fiber protein [Puniceibacterium confluentis]